MQTTLFDAPPAAPVAPLGEAVAKFARRKGYRRIAAHEIAALNRLNRRTLPKLVDECRTVYPVLGVLAAFLADSKPL
jgi:hypothetical protein